ncbi:MAG: glycosyltransferase family 9 protein [Gemmatimonadetes bacterium]|nr:glycosyltransferase family 9 protein [Gemmatimonadota bacterium]
MLFPLYRALRPTTVAPGARVPATVRRVLVVRNDRLGDMILTTPVFDLLRQLAPGTDVDVLASPRNATLLEGDARVARVFVDDGTWRGLWRLRGALGARHYDAVFSLIPGRSIRAGWTAMAASHAGTHRVSTWRPKRYHGFFTRVVRLPGSLRRAHVSRQMSYVVRAAFTRPGHDVAEASALAAPIRLHVPESARTAAAAWLAEQQIGPFVTLNLRSAAAARSWSADAAMHFVPMLLAAHPGLHVVMVPGPADAEEAQVVRRSTGSARVHLFDPNAPLLTLAALVERAAVMITPDTMTLHLAVATGRAVLSLHTTTDGNVPDLWKAVGVPSRALVAPAGLGVPAIAAADVRDAFEALVRDAGIALGD